MFDLTPLLFPQFCIGCGFLGDYICASCFNSLLPIKSNICVYCKKGASLGFTHISCEKKWGIDGFVSAYKYESLLKKIVIQSKYRHAHRLFTNIVSQAPQAFFKTLWTWKKLYSPIMMAVPLHPQRERERGFNQSRMISNHIERVMGITQEKLLVRIKNTTHLANIQDQHMRKTIIKNSFEYIGTTTPKTVILVDDVLTSGATMGECAKTLKKVGVKTVLAVSLAK